MNKWKILYDNLINKYKSEQHDFSNIYTEEHHIVPRWQNGSDLQFNKVTLPFIEHLNAHIYLVEYYNDIGDKKNLNKALMALMAFHINKYIATNRRLITEDLKKKLLEIRMRFIKNNSDYLKGENNPMYGIKYVWIKNDKLKKNKRWKINTPIPDSMVKDGWEFGIYEKTQIVLEYNGQKNNLKQWSKITGLQQRTLSNRIKKGWSTEAILTVRSKLKGQNNIKLIIIHNIRTGKETRVPSDMKIKCGWKIGRNPSIIETMLNGQSNEPKMFIYNEVTMDKKLICKNDKIPIGWTKHKPESFKTNKKMWIKNIELTKERVIPLTDEIPNGWIAGRLDTSIPNKNIKKK